jgi:hypothetical protein
MERMEAVEKLREKAGVTYGEARQALEENGWDLFRAMDALEGIGQARNGARKAAGASQTGGQAMRNADSGLKRFFSWLGDLIHKGNRSYFRVSRAGKTAFDVPVTAAVLLLLLLHGLFLLALLVGVLAGYRARFVSEKEDDAEREAVREAGRAAEEINGYLTVNSL